MTKTAKDKREIWRKLPAYGEDYCEHGPLLRETPQQGETEVVLLDPQVLSDLCDDADQCEEMEAALRIEFNLPAPKSYWLHEATGRFQYNKPSRRKGWRRIEFLGPMGSEVGPDRNMKGSAEVVADLESANAALIEQIQNLGNLSSGVQQLSYKLDDARKRCADLEAENEKLQRQIIELRHRKDGESHLTELVETEDA